MKQIILSTENHRAIASGGELTRTRSLAAIALCASIFLIGCSKATMQSHLPGPPALGLHGPVNDLSAIRASDHVWIGWSMPKKGSAKLAVNGAITVRVWRREKTADDLTEAGGPLHLAPGTAGSFSEELPQALSSGTPRVLYYFVELLDHKGRSTGLSNYVGTLAGGPPPIVEGLTAEMSEAGVLLRWRPALPEGESGGTLVHIRRIELVNTPTGEAANEKPSELPQKDLWIENGLRTGQALDKEIQFGHTYVYNAQRVTRVAVGDATLELEGQFSAPAQIQTVKVSPPGSGLPVVNPNGELADLPAE